MYTTDCNKQNIIFVEAHIKQIASRNKYMVMYMYSIQCWDFSVHAFNNTKTNDVEIEQNNILNTDYVSSL